MNHYETLVVLVRGGASPATADIYGESSLHKPVKAGRGWARCLEFVLQQGVPVNLRFAHVCVCLSVCVCVCVWRENVVSPSPAQFLTLTHLTFSLRYDPWLQEQKRRNAAPLRRPRGLPRLLPSAP